MLIQSPLCITSRLMAGFRFDDGSSISIEYDDVPGDEGRTRYHYCIDLPDGRSHESAKLQSGVGKYNLQYGLASLVDYLRSTAWDFEDGDKDEEWEADWIQEWASDHINELDVLALDLSENELIQE